MGPLAIRAPHDATGPVVEVGMQVRVAQAHGAVKRWYHGRCEATAGVFPVRNRDGARTWEPRSAIRYCGGRAAGPARAA